MDVKDLDQKIRTDFRAFLTLIWRELDLPKPTRAQLCIAEYLQHGPKRLQISAFRGVGKSWITAAFVLWVLYNDPDKKIMVISASKERADNFSIFCQKLIIDIPWLNHLGPKDADQRWSRISFDVGPAKPHQAPSVKSVGITGQMTGSRAHLMVFDDVENPGNSATDMQREKLLQLCTEAESILTPDDDSRILFLGTPQTTFTVYRKLAERSYRPFVWPARYPKDIGNYEGLLAPQLVDDIEKGVEAGTPTDTRFGELDLQSREAAMGRSNFALQFMLDTSLSDAEKFPLKFQDLIVTPLGMECAERYAWSADPRYMIKNLNPVGLPGDRFYGPMYVDEGICEYQETIVSVDPSGRGSDETVAIVLSQANGYVFVRDMKAYRDGYSDATLSDIVRLGKKYKASRLLVESNFGDGMVCELFKRHIIQQQAGFDTEEIRATVRKEERIIDTLEPVMNQHKLIIDNKVWEYDYASNPDAPPERRLEYQLGYQLSRMCREKGACRHDDRVDCLSQGVQWFTDAIAQSAFKSQAMRKSEEWNAMMNAFENDPHQATDALVLGHSFKSLTTQTSSKVWDWV
jgi:hypothetical protein